jgi:hypothetical protein
MSLLSRKGHLNKRKKIVYFRQNPYVSKRTTEDIFNPYTKGSFAGDI